MTPTGRAHLLRRIASFTSLDELRDWWEQACGTEAKTDPDVAAAKERAKERLT